MLSKRTTRIKVKFNDNENRTVIGKNQSEQKTIPTFDVFSTTSAVWQLTDIFVGSVVILKLLTNSIIPSNFLLEEGNFVFCSYSQ